MKVCDLCKSEGDLKVFKVNQSSLELCEKHHEELGKHITKYITKKSSKQNIIKRLINLKK